MDPVLAALGAFIMLTAFLGILRIERGPSGADRMLAAMLFGTTGVALVLVIAEASGRDDIRDVALVFALLGALTAVAFVKRSWGAGD
jgi:multicomponent Na+:H+ antiporter subunit F